MSPDTERALAELDGALVSVALARMESGDAREIELYRDAFESALAPGLASLEHRWAPSLLYAAVEAAPFLEQKRLLERAVETLALHAGDGACGICQGPIPQRALACCQGGVHAECWVTWRLRLPERCLLCRRPHNGPETSVF